MFQMDSFVLGAKEGVFAIGWQQLAVEWSQANPLGPLSCSVLSPLGFEYSLQ